MKPVLAMTIAGNIPIHKNDSEKGSFRMFSPFGAQVLLPSHKYFSKGKWNFCNIFPTSLN
jgi:hypothetical protein